MIQTPNIPTNCRPGKRAESAALQVWLLMLMLQELRCSNLIWLSLFAAAHVE
jgi:hypothetical protein